MMGEKANFSDMVNKIGHSKVNVNRKHVDEILEKIQERNRDTF
jgi:hypothetical protein